MPTTHWPLLLFGSFIQDRSHTRAERLVAIGVVAVAIAVVSVTVFGPEV